MYLNIHLCMYLADTQGYMRELETCKWFFTIVKE